MFHHAHLRASSLLAGALSLSLMACGSDTDVADPDLQEGGIVGRVTLVDAESAAGVLIEAGARSVTTDADGTFRFDDVSAGAVLVSATLEGYHSDEALITVIGGQDNAVDLVLMPRQAGPEILSVSAQVSELAPGAQTRVLLEARNPEGGELSVVWEVDGDFAVEADADNPYAATLSAPDTLEATGTLRVIVTDDEERSAEATLQVSTRGNEAPEVLQLFAQPTVVARGGTVELSVNALDPEGDALSYAWSGPETWELSATDTASVSVIAPELPDVSAAFVVTVTDAYGAQTTSTVQVSTAANQAPRIRAATALPQLLLPGAEFDLSADAVDADGDELLYEWLVPHGWEVDSVVGRSVTATAPDTYSSAGRITLIVSDIHGATDQSELVVGTLNNQGPSISSLITTRPMADPGELIFLEAIASHPVEAELEYSWEASGDFTIITENRPVHRPALRAPNVEGATGTIRLTVTDSAGATAQSALVVQTRHYAAPVIDNLSAISPVELADTAMVSVSAHDPEGGDLSYQWSTTSPNVILLSADSPATEILGGEPGEVVVLTIAVTNSVGKTTRAETRVRMAAL
ncbi:Ig-like domain-containing protein [Lujinxingia litoralis]|nr:carboxypeptidase regulatory-like domain-containing protein [Lujinxingia litoralis]